MWSGTRAGLPLLLFGDFIIAETPTRAPLSARWSGSEPTSARSGRRKAQLQRPEHVAPSAVATSLRECVVVRWSSRLGGGGLDHLTTTHYAEQATADGASCGTPPTFLPVS